MTYSRPFQFFDESTQTITVSAVNASTNLTTAIGSRSIRVVNAGTSVVFMRYNSAATVAASMPILPGTVETFFVPMDATTVNFISSASSTVYITMGEGA